MRKALAVAAVVAVLATVPWMGIAVPPEGCVATNPGTSTCSFTVTHFDPNGGYVAIGDGCWDVEINGVVVASGCGPAAAMLPPGCIPGDVWTGNAFMPTLVLAVGCPT